MKKIKNFRDVFVANEAYAELKDKKVSLQELQDYPILMLDKHSTTSEFLHSVFQQEQLDLVPEIEINSNDLLIDLARIGLGIAFVPDFCLSKGADDLFLVELENELPTRDLALVYNNNVPLLKTTQEFLKYFE